MASLVAPEDFSPVEDAEALRHACQGWGTNERAIISIIGHRNALQRTLIAETYEKLYQEDLIKRFESELSGDFERAVYRWILDPMNRDAVLANVAIRKADYRTVVEIACTVCPEELFAVRCAYMLRYKCSLEEDVAVHTSGDIRKLLVALVSIYRYDGDEINQSVANSEADILIDAIKDKAFSHEEVIRILSTRSKPQLIATFNRYREVNGTSIAKDLQDHLDDEFPAALYIAIRCIIDPKKYYEKVLRNAMSGAGTDEDVLTRVIVRRAEKDLKEIKELYYQKNSAQLEHVVARDTSRHYEAFLLTLLGSEGY